MLDHGQASSTKRLYLALAAVSSLIGLALILPSTPSEPVLRVAFIGNSITFVNDMPRFIERLDGNKYIIQDSCLHGSLNLLSLAYKGNGMYNKWRTEHAVIEDDGRGTHGERNLHDFGACSIPQLLLGHDQELYDENSGKYSDGKNPCRRNTDYLAYRESLYDWSGTLTWDYVVMNDQSRQPTLYRRRKKSLMALRQVYAPLLRTVQATAVFLVTYGYVANIPTNVDDDASAWKDTPTETEDDMPYFTSALYYGYQEYQQVLEQRGVPVRMAHVGLAFLTVWEENRELWRRLFFVDGMHPSPLGTYLEGCVVYATIRQSLPPVATRIEQVSQLWKRARRMNLGKKSYSKYLTEEEAAEQIPPALPNRIEASILSDVCRRVALEKYIPPSLLRGDALNDEFYSNYPDAGYSIGYSGQYANADDGYSDDNNGDNQRFWCSDDDDGGFWCG
eukprot:scaffold2767_cov177-Amphora_coffeaeformis.AAC.82